MPEITAERHDGVTVVTVVGDIDMSNVGTFRSTLVDTVVDDGHRLVLDLTGVTFMDSTGIGALVAAHRRTRVLQGGLHLVCSMTVTRLLGLTALDQVFHLHPDVPTAVTAAARPRVG